MATRTIYLLLTNKVTHWLIDVSRDTKEEALKSLQIIPKLLARWSNTIWDILMVNEEKAKKLVGSILTTKSIRLQTEYMGTQTTMIPLYIVPMDLREEQLEVFFGQVRDISAAARKTGIVTGNYILQVTMTRKNFLDISNILSCWGRNMLVTVEDRRPHCWSCGAAGHLSKDLP